MRTATLIVFSGLATLALQDPQRPVFRTGIDLITVDAIVLDKAGSPITNLGLDDFAVTADGQPRRLVSAQFVPIVTSGAPAPSTSVFPAPRATSNVDLPESRSFVVVVDVDVIRAGGGRVAMDSVAKFLARLAPEDRVGVLTLPSGRPRVDLTTDRAPVAAALQTIVGTAQRRNEDMSIGEAAAIERGSEGAVREYWDRVCYPQRDPTCGRNPRITAERIMEEERRRTRDTLDTLGTLADAMAPIRGLKTLVLVSEGLVRDRRTRGDLRKFAEVAARGRVSVYSLVLATPLNDVGSGGARPPDRALDNEMRFDGMADAATAAGGTAFMISGTPDVALAQIDRELSGYYLLSFQSERSDASPDRHTIDVKVRRADVTVRARTDFYVPISTRAAAPHSLTSAADSDLRTLMGRLLKWPVPVAEMPVAIDTFSGAPSAGSAVRVLLAADFRTDTSMAAVGFEIVGDGKPVADAFESRPKSARPVDGSFAYLGAVHLVPGRYSLKLGGLADDGRRASVEHSFLVREPSTSTIRISDLFVGQETEGGFTLHPSPAGTTSSVDVRLDLQADDPAIFTSASVTLSVWRAGEPRPLTAAPLVMSGSMNEPTKRKATGTVAVGRLAAGEYVLSADVTAPGQPAQRVSRAIRK
jgi:VWFA-related protein